MKIIHTADWHLGKIVQGTYMTDDQKYILDQFINEVEKEKPDVILIAGDVYDRAIPPTEAVDLLNSVLNKLVIELQIPTFIISGNHDSPDRLHFVSSILEKQQLHISGQLTNPVKQVKMMDQNGPVNFYFVPYTEPGKVRQIFQDETIASHNDAYKTIINSIKKTMKKEERHILIGHAFITKNGEVQENTSDSERPLSIGGVEHINSTYLNDFDYVALGHLHQAHFVDKEYIRYAGSPLKYSISEEHHQKGYTLIELKENKQTYIEKKLLTPLRDLRTVEAYLEEIEKKHVRNEDYVYVTLLEENMILFPMEKVRAKYPNAMHVENNIKKVNEKSVSNPTNRENMDPFSLFHSFYKEVTGANLSEEKASTFKSIVDEVLHLEGEKE